MTCVKICVTGPESTGKSKLTKELAEAFKTGYVEEQSRMYLHQLGRKHTFSDLEAMARLQYQEIRRATLDNELVFLDTDLLTYKIWAEDKYQKDIAFVDEHLKNEEVDLYLLCFPDLPWEEDPLREDQHRLMEIYKKYLALIGDMGIPFEVIDGKGKDRLQKAVGRCESFLKKE